MKHYVDIFKKPLLKEDIAIATRLIVRENNPSTSLLTRRLEIGYHKAMNIMLLLEDASVITPTLRGKRTLVIKDEVQAINAALRQLKKGKR